MPTRAKTCALSVLACAAATLAQAPIHRAEPSPGDSLNGVTPIVLDGRFTDWTHVPLAAIDAPTDSEGAFDISHVHATSRDSTLYVRFNTGRTLNLQAGYEDEGTLVWTFTAQSGASLSIDMRARTLFLDGDPDDTISHADVGYIAAPTAASEEFEFKVDLAPIGVAKGDTVTVGVAGSDFIAPFECPLVDFDVAVKRLPTPESPPPTGVVRIANLNVLRGGLTDPARRERMTRLLASADADVYTFQEQWNTAPSVIAQAMNEMLPLAGGSWHVVASGDGTAIASRRPMVEAVSPIDLKSATVGVIDVGGMPLVVVSLHLKCCGFAGSNEDLLRLDAMRTLRQFIDERFGTGPEAPSVIVAGDWNLVGSPTPLISAGPGTPELRPHWPHPGETHKEARIEEWRRRQHERGLELTPLEMRHVDSIGMHTWRDGGSSFPPGRLDYIAVDAPRWTVMGSWVIDAAELQEGERKAMGLQAQDSTVSDHLLMIADFATDRGFGEHLR